MGRHPVSYTHLDKIIAMMVGRSLNQRFPDKENKPGEVILEVRNLTVAQYGNFIT